MPSTMPRAAHPAAATMARRSPNCVVSIAAGTLESSEPTPTRVTMSAAVAKSAPRSSADRAMMGVTAPRPSP